MGATKKGPIHVSDPLHTQIPLLLAYWMGFRGSLACLVPSASPLCHVSGHHENIYMRPAFPRSLASIHSNVDRYTSSSTYSLLDFNSFSLFKSLYPLEGQKQSQSPIPKNHRLHILHNGPKTTKGTPTQYCTATVRVELSFKFRYLSPIAPGKVNN